MFPFKGACPLRIGCNLLEIEKHERSSATESIVCDWAIRAMPNLWGEGVFELRIHYGPGYRVYYGELERVVVILLCGGTKRSQSRDIERAKMYWQDLRSRSHD